MKKNILQYVCPKFKTSHQKSGPKQNIPQVKTGGGVGGMDMGVGKKAKKKKRISKFGTSEDWSYLLYPTETNYEPKIYR